MSEANNQRQVIKRLLRRLKRFLRHPLVLKVLYWMIRIVFWLSGEDTQAADRVFEELE